MDGPLLQLRGIGKNFGPVQALTDVDLDIPAGQVTALVGDNGAGKSTLIKTISGIWEPSHGEILWQGKPVHFTRPKDATEARDRHRLPGPGAVRQPGHRAEHAARPRAAQARLLDEVTMEKTAKQTLNDLPGHGALDPAAGRLAVRRAAPVGRRGQGRMLDAKLVIMDEPTAALGVSQTALVLDLISRLARAAASRVLVVSHNLNDVFQVADRIAVLYLGRWPRRARSPTSTPQSIVDLMTTGTSTARSAAVPAEPMRLRRADQ